MLGPMVGLRPALRRGSVLVSAFALTASLAACDGGSQHASDRSTTTSRRHPRTTTTTGTGGATSSTAPPATSTTSPPKSTDCDGVTDNMSAAALGGDLGSVAIASYDVTGCRRAPSNLIWGAVTLTPKAGQSAAPVTVVLERIGSIWTVHSYGTGATGCDAPPPVPSELGLDC